MDTDDDTVSRLKELLEESRRLREKADAARRGLAEVVTRIRASRAVAGRLRAESAAIRERRAADPALAHPLYNHQPPAMVTLLYVSRLARGFGAETVATIARVARLRNQDDGVTGMLAFDGSNCAQFLEGPANAIVDLEQRLRRDKRHRDIEILSYAPSSGPLRFPHWRLGYLTVEHSHVGIDRLRDARGERALTLFEETLPELDVDAVTALPIC